MSDAIDVPAVIGMNRREWDSIEEAGLRRALEFYARNKAEMDEGVVMLDPVRLPVWFYYAQMVNESPSFVAGEYDQDPLHADSSEEKMLHGDYLLKRRTRTPAFVVPRWARFVTVQVDVQKHCLWVEADAWNAELDTCQVIEFGRTDTGMNRDGVFDALPLNEKRRRVDQVIFDTLKRVHDRVSQGWPQETGVRGQETGVIYPTLCGVDVGGATPLEKDEAHAWQEAVLAWCQPKNSGGRWMPLKGERWTKSISDRAVAAGSVHWILEEKSAVHGRRDCHTDYYKSLHYDALQVTELLDANGVPMRGAKLLHADEGYRLSDDGTTRILSDVRAYAKHCSAEKYVAEFQDGANVERAEKVGWQLVSKGRRENHGWDTGWMGFALRDMLRAQLGVRRRVFGSGSGNGGARNFAHS